MKEKFPPTSVLNPFLRINTILSIILGTSFLLLSCTSEIAPKVEGVWKSNEGVNLIVSKINDNNYDVVAIQEGSNQNTAKQFSGTYIFNKKMNGIYKQSTIVPTEGIIINYTDNDKLFIGGQNSSMYFSRQ